MKKKLLSLVLAGAMVASTSVSAFAEDKVVGGSDESTPTTNVEITGQVLNEDGQAPAGTFKVTVPTATSFTVDENGKFLTASNITIRNGGEQSVNIYADSFTDIKKDAGITVVAEKDLKTLNKTNVSLNIDGNRGTVYLGSAKGDNKKGIYSNSSLEEQTGDFLLSTIEPGSEDNLSLNGNAGISNNSLPEEITKNGVSDRFTLVLKITKTPKTPTE